MSTDSASDASEVSDGVVDDSSATPPKKRSPKRLTVALLAALFVLATGLVVRYQSSNSESQSSTMQGASEEIATINPDDPASWFTRGAIQQLEEGDLEGAIESYNRALELDPRYLKALFNRGFAFKDLGRLEEARLDFAQIVIYNGGQDASALRMVGLIYIEQGERELGEEFLQRAYEQNPSLRP